MVLLIFIYFIHFLDLLTHDNTTFYVQKVHAYISDYINT